MASPQAPEKFFANNKVQMFDHDPDTTNSTAVEWVDMRDYGEFSVIDMASALTGVGTDAFSIVADAESDGSGTNVTVVSHAIASAPDAVGDYLVLTVTAEQIVQEGEDNSQTGLRYVSAVIDKANTADESVVTYIRSKPRFAASGLTADTVSA